MKKILFPKLKNKYDEKKKSVVDLAHDGCLGGNVGTHRSLLNRRKRYFPIPR